jgi:hypothetical protein
MVHILPKVAFWIFMFLVTMALTSVRSTGTKVINPGQPDARDIFPLGRETLEGGRFNPPHKCPLLYPDAYCGSSIAISGELQGASCQAAWMLVLNWVYRDNYRCLYKAIFIIAFPSPGYTLIAI